MVPGIIYTLVIVLALLLFITLLIILLTIIRFSDRIILRWYSARKSDDSGLSRTLKTLAERSGIPCPRLYIIESQMPNIFSVFSCGKGQGNASGDASIVITTGAIKLLDANELESVFAHEMFHIKDNRRTRTATVTAALGGIITASATVALWGSMFLGFGQESDPAPRLIRFFTMSLSAPHAAFMIHLTNSGGQEYAADEYSAGLCGGHENLVRALKKMEGEMDGTMHQVNPSHAHLFIINPLNDDIFNSLFDTHPSVDSRIKRLNEMTS